MRFGDLYKQAQEAGAFQSLIPDGDFIIKCLNANSGSTAAGDDKMGFQFEVVSETNGDPIPDDDPAKGAKGWINLTFGEKAAAISMRQLKDFGLTDSFLESADDVDAVAQAIVGAVYDVSVGHRTWGKNGDQVSNTLKVNEVIVAPVQGESASDGESEGVYAEVVEPY